MRPAEVRASNAKLVLERLDNGEALTRAELAKLTSLTSQALGPILAELVAAGQVIEEPSRRSGPGRPPSAFRLDPLGLVTIGVVIRFADAYVVMSDALGRQLHAERVRHGRTAGPQPLVDQISTTIRELLHDHGVDLARSTRLQVTVEGIVDEERQIVVEAPAWKATNVSLGALFAAALGDGVSVTTVSNEHALAIEALEIVDAEPADLVAIVQISHHTRLLLAVDGVVVSNRLGSTGLLAHFPVVGNERVCDCGRVGCFGTVSSGSAVVRNYFELTGRRVDAAVDVIDRIGAGDRDAIEAASRSIDWLSRALAPLVRMLAPDRLIFTGAVGRPGSGGAAKLVEAVRAELDDDVSGMPIDVVQPGFALSDQTLATALLG